MAETEAQRADRHSRNAALALAGALPCDTLLYLLLPMFAAEFGVSLLEAGVLLAANRIIRIAGYGYVQRFYARRGDALTCGLAVIAAAVCAVGYGLFSGLWLLLPLRLLWGLSFAALNLSTQTMATALAEGASRRSGRSRALIALGPAIALPIGALAAEHFGPRVVFFALAVIALAALPVVRGLPVEPHLVPLQRRRVRPPGSLDIWSFLEGFTLDGLFIIGLSYMARDLLPGGAVMAAGLLMALRYAGEIALSPLGGALAERFGAERLLVVLTLLTCVALVGFGAGLLWPCAAAIVVLRALQLPLLPPIVAKRSPGAQRVQALAARAVWRDIGAGAGPLAAGLLLPVMPSVWLYGLAAVLLALAGLACGRVPRGDESRS